MMIKLIAAATLFGVCCLVGCDYSCRLGIRIKLLEELAHDLKNMRLFIEHRSAPMREILLKLNRENAFGIWGTLQDRLQAGKVLSEAWDEALRELIQNDQRFKELKAAEIAALADFGMGLNSTEKTSQLCNIDITVQRLTELTEQMRDEMKTKGKMYRSLGMLSGLVAVLLVW